MRKLRERLYDLFHYTPIKDGIKNTSMNIEHNKEEIYRLEKEIKSNERQLFYLKGLKTYLLTDIDKLNNWKKILSDKLKDENKERIVEKSLL